jgi:hypothetical protein
MISFSTSINGNSVRDKVELYDTVYTLLKANRPVPNDLMTLLGIKIRPPTAAEVNKATADKLERYSTVYEPRYTVSILLEAGNLVPGDLLSFLDFPAKPPPPAQQKPEQDIVLQWHQPRKATPFALGATEFHCAPCELNYLSKASLSKHKKWDCPHTKRTPAEEEAVRVMKNGSNASGSAANKNKRKTNTQWRDAQRKRSKQNREKGKEKKLLDNGVGDESEEAAHDESAEESEDEC